MSASHPSNIDVVETLGEGLKHLRSSVVKEEQLENMPHISSTLAVSKPETSSEVKEDRKVC